MGRLISTIAIVAALWGLPGLAVVANRVAPSLATGLGIPYAVLFGLVLGTIAFAVCAIAGTRWPGMRPYYATIGVVILVTLLVIWPLADSGRLSIVR